MRNTFADTFYEAGLEDDRLSIVVADISPAGSIEKFRSDFPDRFVNTGVSEQIMIGMCAGMAQRGMRPFAYTIATFALFRPYEMIRDDLCYQNLPVTVVGIGGGVTYSTLGGTHHAMEDVAIANAIPNMTIIAPCDPAETAEATKWCITQERGPVYLRLGKAGEPDFTSQAAEPWEFGKVRKIKHGSDVCILSYGPIIKKAFEVGEALEKTGRSTAIYSAHTIKPLDRETIAKVLAEFEQVIIIEECVPVGGLSDGVKRIAWEDRASCQLDCFTLKDEFIHCYGTHDELLAAHGLSSQNILQRLKLG